MAIKTRKAQVVICGYDAQSQSLAYLLMQTNKKRGEFWQNVTGKIESGETFEQTAIREVTEETGLTELAIIKKLGIIHREATERDGTPVSKDIHMYLKIHFQQRKRAHWCQ